MIAPLLVRIFPGGWYMRQTPDRVCVYQRDGYLSFEARASSHFPGRFDRVAVPVRLPLDVSAEVERVTGIRVGVRHAA